MIHCLPKGLCSWAFDLEGQGHRAGVEFNWVSEQGALVVDGVTLEIRKHGVWSGEWTLERSRERIASAQKSSAVTRTFELQTPMGSLVLRAESAFGRSFRVERSGSVVAAVTPVHPFTRRATIETLVEEFDAPTICFAFWLAVLTWRRAARRN